MADRNFMTRLYDKFCFKRSRLPSQADIEAAESAIGGPFPVEYAEYLRNYNGGHFHECPKIPVVGLTDSPRIHVMYGVNTGVDTRNISPFSPFDEPANEILVIGTNHGGMLFLLVTDVNHKMRGSVLFRTFDKSYFVASNIWEFFRKIGT